MGRRRLDISTMLITHALRDGTDVRIVKHGLPDDARLQDVTFLYASGVVSLVLESASWEGDTGLVAPMVSHRADLREGD